MLLLVHSIRGWNNPDIYDETIKVYLTIIDGVKKAGVNRFLMVGGAGSLFIAPGLRLMDSGEVPENLLPGVKSFGRVLSEVPDEREKKWTGCFSLRQRICDREYVRDVIVWEG